MYDFIKFYAENIFSKLTFFLEKLIFFVEWYSHSQEVKHYKPENHWNASKYLFLDDDEDIVDDFDIYFNEYDWEVEKYERRGLK